MKTHNRPRIINTRKPGALWRFMLQLRTACLMVMTPQTARGHMLYRCREMRAEHERRLFAKEPISPVTGMSARDEAFVDNLSARQGW